MSPWRPTALQRVWRVAEGPPLVFLDCHHQQFPPFCQWISSKAPGMVPPPPHLAFYSRVDYDSDYFRHPCLLPNKVDTFPKRSRLVSSCSRADTYLFPARRHSVYPRRIWAQQIFWTLHIFTTCVQLFIVRKMSSLGVFRRILSQSAVVTVKIYANTVVIHLLKFGCNLYYFFSASFVIVFKFLLFGNLD